MAWILIVNLVVTAILIVGYGVITCYTNELLRVALLLIHGFITALVAGHLWTSIVLRLIRNHIYNETVKREGEIDNVYIDPLAVPGWVVGAIERLFFGTLVTFDISATAAGMVTWILVKMATDWHRILGEGKDNLAFGSRSLAFGSLLGGIVSLLFALIGGLICRGALPK